MTHTLLSLTLLLLLFLAAPSQAEQHQEHCLIHKDPYNSIPSFITPTRSDCLTSTFGCGCTGRSFSGLVFNATSFNFYASYLYTTPSHQSSWGYLSFNVTNTAVGYASVCSAASNRYPDFFYADSWYPCLSEGEVGADEVNDTRLMGAKFMYDRPSGRFWFSQRWACRDQVPEIIRINTTADVNSSVIDIQCSETRWQNPNWTEGEIFSDSAVECDPANFTFRATEFEAWE